MKLALVIASAIAGLAFAASASAATLTIPKLGIYDKPIGNGVRMLDSGPIWDPEDRARPGQGMPMVIAGHDVTPVPGYGGHGPFYWLVSLRQGDLVEIRSHGKLFRYKVVSRPAWHPESDYSVVADQGVEAVWFYSCWPRYTHDGRKWAEAVLVSTTAVG